MKVSISVAFNLEETTFIGYFLKSATLPYPLIK